MKTLIISLIILLVTFQASGQRRSKVDPKDAQIDSLTVTSKNLALQLDSVSGELVKYFGVYNVIRDEVIHYDFDPTRSSYLIDSLKASRDSTFALLLAKPKSTASADSIAFLLKENSMLRHKVDSIKVLIEKNLITVSPEDLEKVKAINSLKQLKELLDAKIITEADFVSLKSKYINKL